MCLTPRAALTLLASQIADMDRQVRAGTAPEELETVLNQCRVLLEIAPHADLLAAIDWAHDNKGTESAALAVLEDEQVRRLHAFGADEPHPDDGRTEFPAGEFPIG